MKERLHTVTLQGRNGSDLVLQRPEFYLDRNKVFEKNRVYVCSGDHRPPRPGLGETVCPICLGTRWHINATSDRGSVILVSGRWVTF